MATLTVRNIVEAGLDPAHVAADAAGDTFVNDTARRTFLHVKNSDAAAHTVTVDALISSVQVDAYGTLAKNNVSVSVPAGGERFIGPFPTTAFGKAPAITYDSVTGLTIAALRI